MLDKINRVLLENPDCTGLVISPSLFRKAVTLAWGYDPLLSKARYCPFSKDLLQICGLPAYIGAGLPDDAFIPIYASTFQAYKTVSKETKEQHS